MPRKGKENNQRYVKLDDSMTESAAWTALSDKAIWTYIELRKQFNYKNGGNSKLILSYARINWRMSRGTFSKAIQELIHSGFIRIVQKGGLMKRSNIFALSDRWKEVSKQIVNEKGREAIRAGLAKKPSHRDNLKNLQKPNPRKKDGR